MKRSRLLASERNEVERRRSKALGRWAAIYPGKKEAPTRDGERSVEIEEPSQTKGEGPLKSEKPSASKNT